MTDTQVVLYRLCLFYFTFFHVLCLSSDVVDAAQNCVAMDHVV